MGERAAFSIFCKRADIGSESPNSRLDLAKEGEERDFSGGIPGCTRQRPCCCSGNEARSWNIPDGFGRRLFPKAAVSPPNRSLEEKML